MPAAVVAEVVGSIVAGSASIYGATKSANATTTGAQLQTQAVEQGQQLQAKATADALAVQKDQLAYERQQTQAVQQARAPYVALENNALTNLGSLLHVPVPQFPAYGGGASPSAAPAPAPAVPNSLTGLNAPAPPAPSAPPASAPPVLMRAPDGSTNLVPAALVSQAMARGIVPVSGASAQPAAAPQAASV